MTTTDNNRAAPGQRTIAQRLAHVERVRQRVESGRIEELENIVTDLGSAFDDLDAIDAWIETISDQVSGRLERTVSAAPALGAAQEPAAAVITGGKPPF